MKKHAANAGLLLLEGAAILLAIIGGGAAFLFWRLEQGPVSLSLFKPSITFAVERRLPAGYKSSIGNIALSKNSDEGELIVSLSDLKVTDHLDRNAMMADSVALSFLPGDNLQGKVGPREIVAEGVKFSIIRNERNTVQIPAVRSKRKLSPILFLSPVFDGRILESAFSRAEIEKAEITFLDEASGRSWVSRDATVSVMREEGRLEARINGNIDLEGAKASVSAIAHYSEESGIVSVDAAGEDFPVGDILSMFYGDRAAIIDAPATGKAAFAFTAGGKVLSSTFSARLGKGEVRLGGDPAPLEFIEWTTGFDPERNTFEIESIAYDINGNSGVFSGGVELDYRESGRAPSILKFDLTGDNLVISLPGKLSEPLPLDRAVLTGAYHLDQKRLSLASFDISSLDVEARGSFAYSTSVLESGEKQSPAISLDLDVDGSLDPDRLLRFWPVGAANGVRNWIEDRLETATIENIRAKLDLPGGAVGEGGLVPDEAMTVEFDVRNAKAYYVKRMTPLTNASGRGVLKGNSFKLEIERGQVGAISIFDGEIAFPEFVPKWRPTYYRFSASGRSDQMLEVLNQEPLRLLSKINLTPDQFQGDAEARFEIMRPNKVDVAARDYRYSGAAKFKNMTIAGLAGDMELTAAEGNVELKPRSMVISADAFLSEAPLDFRWRQNFFAEDGPSSFELSGVLDASTADLFGLSMRRYLRGPVDINAIATGDVGNFKSLSTTFDFTNAAASLEILGWQKPVGASASGEVLASFSEDGTKIEKVKLLGDGLDVNGKAVIAGGSVKSAEFEKFYLEGAADLSAQLSRKDSGEMSITAVGDYINASNLLDQALGNKGGDEENSPGTGISAAVRIDQIELLENVAYQNASLDFWKDAEQFQRLDFSAFSAKGAPLKLALVHEGGAAQQGRVIHAETSDVGEFLKGVFGVASISGGEGYLRLALPEGEEDGITGELEAYGLHVVDAPLLARIFSAGSLDGLANLMNGEGIDFSNTYGKFEISEGLLSVEEFRATGPSVGLTASGVMAAEEGGEVQLTGTLAPLYQLNSALGNAPIIGDILVGKKGEGILALSYSVHGNRTAPEIFVNPLSALTPGIFRQMFQQPRDDASIEDETESPAE